MNASIKTVVTHVAQEIAPLYGSYDQAYSCAWWLIEWLTCKSQAQLRAQDSSLTLEQEQTLKAALYEHVHEHKPLNYILGSVQFLDLTLTIREPILIPRPETEYWCAELINQLKQLDKQDFAILDMCTGSGCIGIALAQAFPQAQVYAVDISSQACTLARENVLKNNVPNITILESNLFSALPPGIRFDVMVSNPPYISHNEWLTLDPSVKNWEDYKALVAPDDGLELIKMLLQQAPEYLLFRPDFKEKSIPQVALEIGYAQGPAVQKLFEQYKYTTIQVQKDLAQHDRVVTAGMTLCR
ncbi:peptide chain release factor N(5)-glutamine methyltransferase [Candidatus Dependentiae bacterium]|nr:peptide chain release factor N(5)-glutamine methyltransferase [Candidatus Dependentiae bacterium]